MPTTPRRRQAHSEPGGVVDSVSLRGVRKVFGRTVALGGVDVSFRPGEIHSVLGENGSGKSTMVKILSGVLPPDEGIVTVDGEQVTRFSPAAARARGVTAVFQEVLVAPNRSITDNVLLGQSSWFRWDRPRAQRQERAAALMQSLTGRELDPTVMTGDLSLMRQHQVAVARALATEPRVLILDESTAALDLDGRDRLFEQVRSLVGRGGVVVFISHRLDEVSEISDRVTVLRSGSVVGTVLRGEYTTRDLLTMMSGEEVAAAAQARS